ncbi:peptide chain release factor N(5)-glutamine methyltransferase [Confluentibacter flavum]|uniref:Release factor glutamine methyltransferase n=1 Tax=Confluentibacter flavum TaxID=1909700 RepID=A0A2N3HIQ8_9FLAO|nr:peptide chain release factor N(5)-glutamine methyltransferase [Confluentibacter flavum]PKQ44859.1 peptide chain release factor N(5)-glutamine methyltransferase [Confluentibacter flavum]
MKRKDIQNIFHQELDVIYNKNEVDSFFFILLESFHNITRIKLAMNPELMIDTNERLFNALERLKSQEPIQYIIGDTEFFGLTFKVNQHVLIPRPETEELVDWILTSHPTPNPDSYRDQHLTILDVGTGSGCIAVSLAKNLKKAKVYALDVSKEALNVARQNAELNQVEITFIEADILKTEDGRWKTDRVSDVKFDVIVSNPPYVREQEKGQMKPNILNSEPHVALFVTDDNPLQFYKAIITFAVNNLKDNGLLFFEINEYLGNDMIQLLKDHHFTNIELKQDVFKKDRMIKGQIGQ